MKTFTNIRIDNFIRYVFYWIFLFPAEFRKVVEEYTADEELFFKDFSKAFAKLISLGVKSKQGKPGFGGLPQRIMAFLGLGA